MSLYTYLALAVSPLLLIVIIVFLKNSSSIASFANIRNSFLFGLGGVVLLFAFSYSYDWLANGYIGTIKRLAFYVLIVIAFSSELGKFSPMRLVTYNLPSIKGPIEGIVYSIITGLGFSTFAVALFAFGLVGKPLESQLLFLYLYPFANIVFSIASGFFLGLGKMRKNALIDHSSGLFLATFLHGMFYFSFITSDIRLLIITLIGLLIIAGTLLFRAVALFNDRD